MSGKARTDTVGHRWHESAKDEPEVLGRLGTRGLHRREVDMTLRVQAELIRGTSPAARRRTATHRRLR